MKYLLSLLIVLVLFNCKGKQTTTVESPRKIESVKPEQPKVYDFNTTNLVTAVKELSSDAFEGRRTGTKGAEKAKQYIIEKFHALKVDPLGAHYEQYFTFKARGKNFKAVNVLTEIKGSAFSDKYIVFSAHYDHEGVKKGKIYNGADDDASGISALFALAEYFKKNPPKHSVILAAFDGEELGLKGAYHFVKQAKQNIVLNLNMDMISRSEDNELFAVGSRYTPKLKPVIEAHKNFGQVNLVIGHEGLTSGDNWTYSSDHAAFHKANIPFVYFGVADHEDYHKPTDDFENIDQEFYKDAVQIIINTFKDFDVLSF